MHNAQKYPKRPHQKIQFQNFHRPLELQRKGNYQTQKLRAAMLFPLGLKLSDFATVIAASNDTAIST